MISSLANSILFLALVTTSVIVAVMYLKLKKFEAHQADYKRFLDQTGQALLAAESAVKTFGTETKDTLLALEQRMNEARALIRELDARTKS
jgi:uncharacterized protein (UPF0333 family)